MAHLSGLTVMTAMAGMLLMGTRIFQGFGIATMLVVAISLVGSLTVLPAILSKLGDRVDRGRIPFVRRLAGGDGESRVWGTIVGAVLRRPLVFGGAAATLLILLALPAFRLHTADSGVQGLIFATLGMIDFKLMGVGLAIAVLLDATVVRAPVGV